MKNDLEPKRLVIDVAAPCVAWRREVPGIARLARETARAALADAGIAAAEVSLVLSDDATVRALNRRWRGHDTPTNVLSFASGESRMLGDVVLAFETVSREAIAQGKPLAHHVRHLIVHGVLHLLGQDHERDREATRMENRERRILDTFKIPDPYSPSPLEGEGWGGGSTRLRSNRIATARAASPPPLTLPLKGGGAKKYSGARRNRHD
jgi:probable rRNA maturation factor